MNYFTVFCFKMISFFSSGGKRLHPTGEAAFQKIVMFPFQCGSTLKNHLLPKGNSLQKKSTHFFCPIKILKFKFPSKSLYWQKIDMAIYWEDNDIQIFLKEWIPRTSAHDAHKLPSLFSYSGHKTLDLFDSFHKFQHVL